MFRSRLSLMVGDHAASPAAAARATIIVRKDIIELFLAPPGKKIRLRDYDTGWAQTKEKELGKDVIKNRTRIILEKNLEALA